MDSIIIKLYLEWCVHCEEIDDFEGCIYCDTEEIGLRPKTSHPRFVSHFTAEFYYDCTEEESPFESDEGADTLAEIQEQLRENPHFDFSAFPKKLIETI